MSDESAFGLRFNGIMRETSSVSMLRSEVMGRISEKSLPFEKFCGEEVKTSGRARRTMRSAGVRAPQPSEPVRKYKPARVEVMILCRIRIDSTFLFGLVSTGGRFISMVGAKCGPKRSYLNY